MEVYISKILGYLFILVGCSGLGIWHGMRMQQKVWHLEEMIRILDMFISEIDYERSTLPECCKRIYESVPEPYGSIFCEISERTGHEEGLDFREISREIMTERLRAIPIEKEKDIFIRCFSDVGYADEWMQKRNIERGKKHLQEIKDTEERDIKKRSKLAVSLGAMSGILLVLILL